MSSRTCAGCGRAAAKRKRTCGDLDCHRADRLRTASERAQAALEAFDAMPWSSPIVAKHAGRCACCTTYISAGRSTIVAHMPTPPLVVHVDRDGNPEYARTRSWSHEKCLDRLEAEREANRNPTTEDHK